MTQQTLPGLPGHILKEIADVETDILLERIETILPFVSTGPWRADIMQNCGDNWLIADLGADQEMTKWIVTTDRIRASQMEHCDARADAEFIAIARTLLPELIERVRRQA